jgi:hypothetical protein
LLLEGGRKKLKTCYLFTSGLCSKITTYGIGTPWNKGGEKGGGKGGGKGGAKAEGEGVKYQYYHFEDPQGGVTEQADGDPTHSFVSEQKALEALAAHGIITMCTSMVLHIHISTRTLVHSRPTASSPCALPWCFTSTSLHALLFTRGPRHHHHVHFHGASHPHLYTHSCSLAAHGIITMCTSMVLHIHITTSTFAVLLLHVNSST